MQLCLESPLATSLDLGAAAFRMPILRNLFHHGFHCICHLLVSRSGPESSMLCPLLIDPLHPVITGRFQLMAEQPSALPKKPKEKEIEVPEEEVQEEVPEEVQEPAPKQRKVEDLSLGAFGFHEDVSQWDD